jgi:hypothetical protein
MAVIDDLRRVCGTHWPHVLGVCVTTAVAIAALLTMMTGRPFFIVMQHSLVHSLTMGFLCGVTLPTWRRACAAGASACSGASRSACSWGSA